MHMHARACLNASARTHKRERAGESKSVALDRKSTRLFSIVRAHVCSRSCARVGLCSFSRAHYNCMLFLLIAMRSYVHFLAFSRLSRMRACPCACAFALSTTPLARAREHPSLFSTLLLLLQIFLFGFFFFVVELLDLRPPFFRQGRLYSDPFLSPHRTLLPFGGGDGLALRSLSPPRQGRFLLASLKQH